MTTRETIDVQVEAYNPYQTDDATGRQLNHVWTLAHKLRDTDRDNGILGESDNPYDRLNDKEVFDAWNRGYSDLGITPDKFDHPVPTDDNGIFIMPDIITMGEPDARRATPVVVWQYDKNFDKQVPPVRPLWSEFPAKARCVKIADGHAWQAALRWIANAEIRGTKHHELPCPPYQYEQDGTNLTIIAGAFKKSGSKAEWESVIQEMQAEVDELPDGFDISDDYVNVDLSGTVSVTVSVSATSVLSGHDQVDDDMWTGSVDDYHAAVEEATSDYDYSYEVSDSVVDTEYVEWEVDDVDLSDLAG